MPPVHSSSYFQMDNQAILSLLRHTAGEKRSKSSSSGLLKMFKLFPMLTSGCKMVALLGRPRKALLKDNATTGTIFGYRKGRVSLAIQEDPHCVPRFVIELPMHSSLFHKEMASDIVRIALESETKTHKKKLLEEFVWAVYCNGRKVGYSIRRKQMSDDELFVQGMDEDKGPPIRKLYVELLELWPDGSMDNHGIKNAIYRAKERRKTFYNNEKVQEKARLEEVSKCWKDINVGGKATSVAQAKRAQEGHSTPAAITQYLSGPAKPLPPFLKGRNDDSPKQEKLEKMTFPMLKEQMKQQRREFNRGLKKSSPKVDKESHMTHKQEVEQQDGLKHHLTTSSSSLGQQN